jgi:hypothetical protein
MSANHAPDFWSIILIAFGLALTVLAFEGIFTFTGCGSSSFSCSFYSLDLVAFLDAAACVLVGIVRLAHRFPDLRP